MEVIARSCHKLECLIRVSYETSVLAITLLILDRLNKLSTIVSFPFDKRYPEKNCLPVLLYIFVGASSTEMLCQRHCSLRLTIRQRFSSAAVNC